MSDQHRDDNAIGELLGAGDPPQHFLDAALARALASPPDEADAAIIPHGRLDESEAQWDRQYAEAEHDDDLPDQLFWNAGLAEEDPSGESGHDIDPGHDAW